VTTNNVPNKSPFAETLSALRSLGLSEEADAWQNRYDSAFTEAHVDILVIGEFNHGKSSLINMLVGEDVLRVGLTPTTQVETNIGFGAEHAHAVLHEMNGSKRTIELSELGENDSVGVARIDVLLNSDRFDRAARFVDTPGLNETHALRESLIRQLIERASLVLFVLDATQPATRQEMSLIESSVAVLQPHQGLIVVNKCDRLDEDELKEVGAYIEKTVSSLFDTDEIFYTSARKKNYEGNAALIDKINEIVAAQKSVVASVAQKRCLTAAFSRTAALLWFAHACADLSKTQLQSVIKAFSTARNDVRMEMRMDAVNRGEDELTHKIFKSLEKFESDFQNVIDREIEKVSINDVETYLDGFVHSEYRTWLLAQRTEIVALYAKTATEVLAGVVYLEDELRTLLVHQLERLTKCRYIDLLLSTALAKDACAPNDGFTIERLVRLPGIYKFRIDVAKKHAHELIADWAKQLNVALKKDVELQRNIFAQLTVLDNGALAALLCAVAKTMLQSAEQSPDLDDLDDKLMGEWNL